MRVVRLGVLCLLFALVGGLLTPPDRTRTFTLPGFPNATDIYLTDAPRRSSSSCTGAAVRSATCLRRSG